MATIEEVKTELDRRGAWNFVEHKRRLHFLIVSPDGYTSSRSWIEDNQWGTEAAVDIVDRIWPESVGRRTEPLPTVTVAETIDSPEKWRRLRRSLGSGVSGFPVTQTTVDPDQTDDFTEADYRRMVERVVAEKEWTDLYGTPAPPVLKEGLRPPEYVPMSPHGYREAQRLLSQTPPIKIHHPETETADDWASEQSSPLDDIQRLLHHDRRKDAKPTPAGIASLIRDGIAPHEYPQREGKIELGVRDGCHCILCSLPRGDSWGEVELHRRIEWMGQQAHRSLHAMGAWLSWGRTVADERPQWRKSINRIVHTDPSLGVPFDSTGRYREIVRDVLKGPLFSQRQKGSINGK